MRIFILTAIAVVAAGLIGLAGVGLAVAAYFAMSHTPGAPAPATPARQVVGKEPQADDGPGWEIDVTTGAKRKLLSHREWSSGNVHYTEDLFDYRYTIRRYTGSSTKLFRGVSMTADELKSAFKNGLRSRGDSDNLPDHLGGKPVDDGFISATPDSDIARRGVATGDGYILVIDSDYGRTYGIDANATLGKFSPHPGESEVSFHRSVPADQIRGAYPVKGWIIDKNNFIPNLP